MLCLLLLFPFAQPLFIMVFLFMVHVSSVYNLNMFIPTPSQMHTTSTELVNLDLIDPKQVNDVRCYECSWCESHIAIDSEVIIDANIDANVIANDEIVDDISIDVDMVQYDLVTL